MTVELGYNPSSLALFTLSVGNMGADRREILPHMSTSISTNTIEVMTPAATTYAACSSDNIISSVNALAVSGRNRNSDFLDSTTASAYDCCVLCITTPGCSSSSWSNAFGQCGLDITREPIYNQPNVGFQYSVGGCPSVWLASNELCGHGTLYALQDLFGLYRVSRSGTGD